MIKGDFLMTVHKKHEEHKSQEISDKKQVTSNKKEEVQSEPVVVSDTVTETTERIEVVEEISPENSDEKVTSADPLTEFKEKMSKEEKMPPYPPAKKNYMWPILFIFIVALALMIGIFVYKNGLNKSEKVNVVTLSPTPTVIPTPTIVVDLSKYEIRVLNGSEVNGEAGRQRDSLEGEGFTVSSVGNAAKSDYTKTIIQAKKEVDKEYLDRLSNVLESSFTIGDQEELSEDASSDVVVIIGSETN